MAKYKFQYSESMGSFEITRDKTSWFCSDIDKIPPYLIEDLRQGAEEWESSGRRPGTGKNYLRALEAAVDYAQDRDDLFHEDRADWGI